MKMLELFSMKRGTVGAPYVKKVPQVALYLNLILLFSYGVAFGLCRFSYTFCFKVFLEIFFHFFGSGFSDNSNTVVVDFYTLVSFPIFVFGFADYNLWINSCTNSGVNSVSCVIAFAFSMKRCKPSVAIFTSSSSVSSFGTLVFSFSCSVSKDIDMVA